MKRNWLFLSALGLCLLPAVAFCEKASVMADNEVPLKLLATVVGSDSSIATCGIMDLDTGKESVHKIGDEVKGYQIAMVTRGSITLLKEGKYYFLNLLPGNENIPVAGEGDNPAFIKIKRALLEGAVGNINAVCGQSPLTPYIESGKIVGLTIPHLNSRLMGLLLKTTGLKEGDVTTSINGETIDSIKKALELYNKYKNEQRIEVEIKRGGTVRNLNFLLN